MCVCVCMCVCMYVCMYDFLVFLICRMSVAIECELA